MFAKNAFVKRRANEHIPRPPLLENGYISLQNIIPIGITHLFINENSFVRKKKRKEIVAMKRS